MPAMTVTATAGGVVANGVICHVYEVTGAKPAAAQAGAKIAAQIAASLSFTQSITTAAGNNVYGASARGGPSQVSTGSNAAIQDDIQDNNNAKRWVTFHAVNCSAITLARGYTIATTAQTGPLALLEIQAATTLAESSPVGTPAAGSATTVTSGSWTPADGALLVVPVMANGGAGVVTVTVSGGGLTWTEVIKNNPSGGWYAGVWIATVPYGIAGSSAGSAAANGTIAQTMTVSGSAPAASSASGTLSLKAALTGTADGDNGNAMQAAGTVAALLAISGTAAAASAASGSVSLKLALAGTAASASAASGAVSLFTPIVLAGSAVAVSAASGTLSLNAALAGASAAIAGASGDAVIVGPIACYGTSATASGAWGAVGPPPPPVISFPVPASAPLGAWTFYADTTVGRVPLGPLRPSAFTCSWVLSGFGAGAVTLPAEAGAAIGPDLATRLWAWRLWAYYAGVPVWCGCPTGVTDNGGLGVAYTMTELTGYLSKRQYDVVGGHTYTQVEQATIAADLAGPVSDVGVSLVTQAGPGFLRDRQYTFLEGDSRAYLLTELSQVLSGPEYRSEYATAGGVPSCTLRVAYPRVGSSATGLGITVPGGGVSYEAQWDSDQLRTHTFAVGDLPDNAPTTASKPVKVVDQPQPDLPRLDAVDDWPGVVLASTLAEKANADASKYSTPILALTAVATTAGPALGTYGVGDDVTVAITSPMLPGGYAVTGRLIQIDADAAAGTAKWTVSVNLPPPRARLKISDAISRLGEKQQLIFRRSLATPS
jgi:hypothetical protein